MERSRDTTEPRDEQSNDHVIQPNHVVSQTDHVINMNKHYTVYHPNFITCWTTDQSRDSTIYPRDWHVYEGPISIQ